MNFLGFSLKNPLFLAPMAGITDKPFRQLCKKMGAGMAVSEMVTSNSLLYGSAKTHRRANHAGEEGPVSVQIAGSDPQMMAAAARHNVDNGAAIIDINMGCPAKKVCHTMAGSALMQDEALVARILVAVVEAVPETPVTLKCRTGWDMTHKNAPAIAKIAENAGIRAIAIHGRTRCQHYHGEAEYDTIALIKSVSNIPVIANGDIDSPEKAAKVLQKTGADALMIGRAAEGRPWIFGDIAHFLETGEKRLPPTQDAVEAILLEHLESLYSFYGKESGVKMARKHIAWYTRGLAGSAAFRHAMNLLPDVETQSAAVRDYFLSCSMKRAASVENHSIEDVL